MYYCVKCNEEMELKSDLIKHRKICKLNVLDLFCGCGGLTKGLLDSGLNVIAGIDVWNIAIDSYNENFDHDGICEDLTTYEPDIFEKEYGHIGEIDIIVGGPSCQGFSIAGRRDKNDPRNSLFMEFYKYLKHFQPLMFMMENVIGLLSMKTETNIKVIDIT